MNSVEKALAEVGLTENEAKVYLTLLRVGESTASAVAEHSGIYRPYVYDNLKRLLDKGLASYVRKEGVKYYSAARPEEFEDLLERKRESLHKALPSLQALSRSVKEGPNVQVFQGRRVVRVIQKDVLKTLIEKGGESLIFGVDEKKFLEVDAVMLGKLFSTMQKHGLKERVLVREGDNYLPGGKSTTEYRFVSKEFFNPQSTFVYADKVAIVLFTEPLYGILIESAELADSYRKQFNLVWRHAKKRDERKKKEHGFN